MALDDVTTNIGERKGVEVGEDRGDCVPKELVTSNPLLGTVPAENDGLGVCVSVTLEGIGVAVISISVEGKICNVSLAG